MIMRRSGWLILAGLLVFSGGCARYEKQLTPDELNAGLVEDLDVLTRDGSTYHLTTAVVTSREINGTGRVYAPGDSASVFRGRIPMEDVALVQIKAQDPLVNWLTITAAVALVAVVGTTTNEGQSSISYWSPYSSGGWGSCPFVYSFDGEQYRLEGEPFVGSICRQLERTTLNVLPHLEAHEGCLTLALCNQAPESHYVDNVRLLAVEHAAGTQLVAGAAGGLHAVGPTAPPRRARDGAGHDVTSLIDQADGRHWSSDLARIDPHDDTTLTDTIECTFTRPRGAERAQIMVSLCNSDLAEFGIHELLALCGPRRIDWYADLATDPWLRMKLLGWILREGCLTVEVWDGDAWRQRGMVPQVGGAVTVAQCVPVRLPASDEDELRVRLKGTSGLWRIDQVGIDWSPPPRPGITPLPLAAFETNVPGHDATAVAADDQNYLPLYPDQWAVLQYAAPVSPAAGKRSYVLEAGGHYYHWPTQTATECRRDLIERILVEPLLGSRLLIGKWLTVHHDIPAPQPPPSLPGPAASPLSMSTR
jgi:hypothetical protein